MVVAGNIPSAIDALRKARQQPSIAVGERNAVSILYASKGGPAPDPMGWQVVYRGEQGFRSAFDECALLIRAMLSIDLLEAFDPAGNKEAIASMPALSFCWEYALLCLLRSWGIRPGKFVCEGTAGFVAAVLSGTMKMEDAIRQGLTGEPGEQAVPRSGEQVAGKETGDGNNILLLHDEGDMDLLRHATDKMPVVCLLRDRRDDGVAAMRVVGELWRLGVRVDWDKVNSSRRYCRLSLPAYPFERQPYWIQGRNNPLSTGQANDQSLPGSKYGSRQERSPDDPYIAPVTETEEALAAIWQAAFGLEAISVHDNFFDMGGHSLMGIQILARVRDQFGLNLPPGTLYERPTLASFAALIDNKLWLMKAPEPAYEESGLSYTEEGII
jgi:acyl transferase domain-containing protein